MHDKQQQHIAVLASLMQARTLASDENPGGDKNDIHLNGKVHGYIQALNVMYGNEEAIEIEREAMAEAGCETPII